LPASLLATSFPTKGRSQQTAFQERGAKVVPALAKLGFTINRIC